MVGIYSYSSADPSKSYTSDLGYLGDVYKTLKNEEFVTAKITSSQAVLKDKEFHELKTISLSSKEKPVQVIAVEKQEGQMLFVLGGSVDDNEGVLFCDTNRVNMEGLWEIKRVSGNAYYFSTRR